jgi:superfamily II DNA/RNA helicase
VQIDNSYLNDETFTARIMKYVHGYIESQMPNYETASYPTIREGLFADEGPSPPSPKWINSIPFSMMIFFNTAKSAQKFGNDLLKLGYDGLYAEVHGALTKQQRAENLAEFMKQERAKILLCTDACARGLDLPFVKCIVQAEFSLNVVQHLHRVGRSSRGGKRGFAVNFFSNSQEQLVKSIKGQLNECHQSPESTDVVMSNNTAKNNAAQQRTPIEESFSRRRGFRRKLRKQKITFDNRGESFHDN